MATTRKNQKNLQYHFVVFWDEGARRWRVDADTLDAKFDTEVIWDNDAEDWISYADSDKLKESFTEREDALISILDEYNALLAEDDLTNEE